MGVPRRESGFTLIELLVVILIIGVLASVAVISMPSTTTADRQRTEARRLLGRMELAREESVLQARSVGLRLERDGYRFVRFEDNAWRDFGSTHPLGVHQLPQDIRIEIDLDGVEVGLIESDDDDEETDAFRPHLYFLAGGEIMPGYTLYLYGEDTSIEFRIRPGDERWFELSEHDF